MRIHRIRDKELYYKAKYDGYIYVCNGLPFWTISDILACLNDYPTTIKFVNKEKFKRNGDFINLP